ncbi:DUF2326 domain-containing protein [Cellulomonas iranensis]|uniref:DUF2326 domain-containing protein n=1 Tax=Cellulomonas iranensis TaxID=76862 RepID=UPI001CF19A47|nr:DUF2326 domain-containing protein [Cellulomonas iranensis]UCN13611.1 DUF2326 domain-containing protein [Cellulomonas iranensis]
MRLRKLSANFSEFRTVEFRDGLNIVVADRAQEATKTDSRNGLGKTTVIALIDFCLGANMSPRTEQMTGRSWEFALEVTTRSGVDLRASRSPDSPASIVVEGDVVAARIVGPDEAPAEGPLVLGPRQWTAWLGRECFPRGGIAAEPPTFRSLFRHLARYRSDSLIDPFRTLANQRAEAVQAENAYLLNLDWRLAKQWASLRDQKSRIALADDPESSIDSRIAALEPHLVRLQRRANRLANDISSFSVLPEYREIETRVQRSTTKIKAITNEIFADRQQLELYEAQARDESAAESLDVHSLFAEASVVLREDVVRSLAEAIEFQRQVAANRIAYLEDEKRRVRERVEEREHDRAALAAQQEQDLQLLRSGGAFDDFASLQRGLAEAQVEVAQTEEQIRTLRELSKRKAQIKSEELALTIRTELDLQERFELRAEMIARFGEIMEALYGEPADLMVSPGRAGVKFEVALPRTGSGGVHLMAIFAYDIALSEDLARRNRGPGFLLHDSSIFADVDERQTARAIEIASVSASSYGYQHLLTMNSDYVPWGEFGDRRVFEDAVVLTLHDGDEFGSILGQRLHTIIGTESD